MFQWFGRIQVNWGHAQRDFGHILCKYGPNISVKATDRKIECWLCILNDRFRREKYFQWRKVPWIARKSLGFRNVVEISVKRQHIKICRTMDHLVEGKLLTVQLHFIYMPWLILRINCPCPPGDSQLLSCRVFEIDMQPGRNELVSEIWHIRTHQNWVAFCVQGSRVS